MKAGEGREEEKEEGRVGKMLRDGNYAYGDTRSGCIWLHIHIYNSAGARSTGL